MNRLAVIDIRGAILWELLAFEKHLPMMTTAVVIPTDLPLQDMPKINFSMGLKP